MLKRYCQNHPKPESDFGSKIYAICYGDDEHGRNIMLQFLCVCMFVDCADVVLLSYKSTEMLILTYKGENGQQIKSLELLAKYCQWNSVAAICRKWLLQRIIF